DGILFQGPEMVEWSKAEQSCQKYNGTLFKPNETSFDVPIFRKCNFNDDLWVAANYIKIAHNISDPHIPSSSLNLHNWTEARQWCSERLSEFVDKFQTVSYLSFTQKCNLGCFWTGNVIKVQLQSVIARAKEPAECGIVHNGAISFTNCTRNLQPLCERETLTALETPQYYFSERNNSCILMYSKITPMPPTERTNELHATITTSCKYGTLSKCEFVVIESNIIMPCIIKTNIRYMFLSIPDTSIIIGAVVGGAVFLILTVLGIICVRRKLLKRPFHSKQESKHMNMHKTNTTHKPNSHYQRQDAPLESDYGLTPFAELESKCDESRSNIVGPKSNPGKSAFTIAPEGSNFSYAPVAKKVNVISSNLACKINDDTYDHLNDIQQSIYDTVAGNLYDTTNVDQINDSTYDISGGHRNTLDEGVGLYDRVNTTICSEYETTDDLRRDSNAAYDHI
ncbi:hypothetical protein ACJMK2_022185, partial [Sinanodonta woodiana]